VDASSNKMRWAGKVSFPYWQLTAMPFCPKGNRVGSVGKWIGFELVGDVTVQFQGGAVSFSVHQNILASPFCPCVRVRGKSAGASSACSS